MVVPSDSFTTRFRRPWATSHDSPGKTSIVITLGKDVEVSVKLFYEVFATSDHKSVIVSKLRDLKTYDAKLKGAEFRRG
jgi:hypothetical protein